MGRGEYMIYISPRGGLGNMIRVYSAAYDIKHSLHKDVSIFWDYQNIECKFKEIPMDYYEIFEDSVLPIVYDISNDIKIYRNSSMRINGCGDTISYMSSNDIETNDDIVIYSWSKFYNTNNTHIDYLTFKPEYLHTVDMLLNNIDNIVGIHMRRGDFNIQTPTSLFIYAMYKELYNNKDVVFYVATDNVVDEKLLITIFGDKIIINDKHNDYDRASSVYMKNGIIDFIALSKCNKIIGSNNNTFSQYASIYGHNKLIMV